MPFTSPGEGTNQFGAGGDLRKAAFTQPPASWHLLSGQISELHHPPPRSQITPKAPRRTTSFYQMPNSFQRCPSRGWGDGSAGKSPVMSSAHMSKPNMSVCTCNPRTGGAEANPPPPVTLVEVASSRFSERRHLKKQHRESHPALSPDPYTCRHGPAQLHIHVHTYTHTHHIFE